MANGTLVRFGVALAAGAAAIAGLALASPAQASFFEGEVRGKNALGAIDGRYIVVLKEGRGDDQVAAFAKNLNSRYGATIGSRFTSSLTGFIANLSESAAKRVAADPAVDFIEQDRHISIAATQRNPVWNLDRVDQESLPLSGTFSYPADAGSGATVYVVDTGVRLTHREFAGRAKSGYDFVDDDTDASDCNGHGTHVAGTVAGATFGVAKRAQVVAVRVLDCDGDGTNSQVIAGIDWVTKHAVKPAVANLSLGGDVSQALDAAVRRSIAAGITYAVAAGNDDADACTASPARVPDAITVGATDRTDRRASFSNHGRCLDLFAPGAGIRSASYSGDRSTEILDGTSMATPHVAGAIALYLADHLTATPAQVRAALLKAATANELTYTGAGSPNRLLNVTGL